MTELDSELGPLAAEVIEEYGKSVDLISVDSVGYDPATGKATNANQPVGVKAIVEEYDGEQVTGLVQVGDKKLTMSAVDFATQALRERPATSSKVVIDGGTFTIYAAKAVYSGELPCLYILQARK